MTVVPASVTPRCLYKKMKLVLKRPCKRGNSLIFYAHRIFKLVASKQLVCFVVKSSPWQILLTQKDLKISR